jgi:methyl-accepting chemotaxis protein
MLSVEQIEEWLGQAVVDVEDERIGKLEEVYYAAATGDAVIGRVKSGMFGRHTSLVPLAGASVGREYLKLAYSAKQIERAGSEVEPRETLDANAAQQLGSAYGLEIPPEDLESATRIGQRRRADQQAAREANKLDEEARVRAEEADEAHSSVEEAADTANRKAQEAEEARAAAEQAHARAERLPPR